MKSFAAVLVIDVQQSFCSMPFWRDDDLPLFCDRQNALIAGCQARGVPVVRIFHVSANGPFSIDSGLVAPLPLVQYDPDTVFYKHHHSALAGTGLQAWLTARGVNRLLISGIRTEQCCETTARHASDAGFEVDFITEATLTFPMRHAGSGKLYSSADIKERTELVIGDRFARIRSVAEVLGEL